LREHGHCVLALLLQGSELLTKLREALHTHLVLIVQFVQLDLAGLLFFQLIVALVELVQALGDLLVQGKKRIGRIVLQGLERFVGQYPGQVREPLLKEALVVFQCQVLLLKMALRLLVRVLGGLQLLVEASGFFLQGEQGPLARLVVADFGIRAP